MKTFFKWFGLALAVQVLLISLALSMGSVLILDRTVPDRFLTIYEPFIILILRSGNYRGESTMIVPVMLGVPLGIFVYSLLVGALALLIRRLRRVNSPLAK